jgi:hypothetical protein
MENTINKEVKMRKTYLELAGILMLVCMMTQAGATTATNLIVDYSLTGVDTNLRPGDSGILTIVIKNTGGYAAEGVDLWVPDEANIHAPKRWYLGNIEAGNSKTISTTVRVDGNARIGLHTLQARLTYDATKSDGTTENDKTSSWDIPIRVYGKADFQFDVAYTKYTEDTQGKLSVNVKPKIDVREASSILTSSCTAVVGSGKQYLGEMKADTSYLIEYEIKPTETGICSMTILLSYYDASGSSSTENASIGINVDRSSIDLKVVDIEDGNLALGGTSNIKLVIKNLGNTKASDVTAILNLTSPFTPVKSSQRYVGDIQPDQTTEALFTVSVDSSAQKKSYSIPVTIEYYDQANAKQTVSINLGLSVGGNADIKVNLDEKDVLVAGKTGKVTIGVVNRGFVDAKFLTLRLLGTADYQVTSADSAYIGALNSDDSDSQDFDISINGNLTKEKMPLKVRVEYKEENNDKIITKDETIDVSILSTAEYAKQSTNGGAASILAGIVGVLVVLVGGYLGIWVLARMLGLATSTLDRKIFKRDSN